MENEVAYRQLHDRATRGESLTEAERAQLAAWYEQQDAEEDALLTSSAPAPSITLQGVPKFLVVQLRA